MKLRRQLPLLACFSAFLFSAPSIFSAVITVDPGNLVTGYISLGEWNTNGNFESWSLPNHIVGGAVTGGTLNGSVNDGSNDPQLLRQNFSGLGIDLDSGDYDVIEVRINRTGNVSRFDIFWGTTDNNGISGTRWVDDQNLLPSDGSFQIIQFDMSAEAAWTSTLDDMRIDPFSDTATGSRSFQIDYVRVGSVIPEPSSAMLLGFGLLGLVLFRRRQRACVVTPFSPS